MARRAGAVRREPIGDPFGALGDPNRRAIVELLRSEGRSVQEIADALPISRPAVSRHLRLLKRAGLVQEEPLGTRRIYRLHDEGIAGEFHRITLDLLLHANIAELVTGFQKLHSRGNALLQFC